MQQRFGYSKKGTVDVSSKFVWIFNTILLHSLLILSTSAVSTTVNCLISVTEKSVEQRATTVDESVANTAEPITQPSSAKLKVQKVDNGTNEMKTTDSDIFCTKLDFDIATGLLMFFRCYIVIYPLVFHFNFVSFSIFFFI